MCLLGGKRNSAGHVVILRALLTSGLGAEVVLGFVCPTKGQGLHLSSSSSTRWLAMVEPGGLHRTISWLPGALEELLWALR